MEPDVLAILRKSINEVGEGVDENALTDLIHTEGIESTNLT
jgi:hypothetical protein